MRHLVRFRFRKRLADRYFDQNPFDKKPVAFTKFSSNTRSNQQDIALTNLSILPQSNQSAVIFAPLK
jgi:hypothetical protein